MLHYIKAMADPTEKRFEVRKSVSMTAAFARAIEREAKRQRISEGKLMRQWIEMGRDWQAMIDEQGAPR